MQFTINNNLQFIYKKYSTNEEIIKNRIKLCAVDLKLLITV